MTNTFYAIRRLGDGKWSKGGDGIKINWTSGAPYLWKDIRWIRRHIENYRCKQDFSKCVLVKFVVSHTDTDALSIMQTEVMLEEKETSKKRLFIPKVSLKKGLP